jgi:hypothetical protein
VRLQILGKTGEVIRAGALCVTVYGGSQGGIIGIARFGANGNERLLKNAATKNFLRGRLRRQRNTGELVNSSKQARPAP